MTTTHLERQTESEDFVSERELVDFVMRHWRFMSWTELLSADVVLTLKPSTIRAIAGLRLENGMLRAEGRDEATRVLKTVYDDLRDNFVIATKLISGFDLVLGGNLVLKSGRENTDNRVVPLSVFITFVEEGKVARMSILELDLEPVVEALRNAARSGGGRVDLPIDLSDSKEPKP